ncbi:MAG: hypothetical protein ACYTBS_22210 [Planctomycetota bacterium]
MESNRAVPEGPLESALPFGHDVPYMHGRQRQCADYQPAPFLNDIGEKEG